MSTTDFTASSAAARLERDAKTSTTREVGWPLIPRAITPDTPEHILTEISHSPKLARFKDELIRGAQARQALMVLRQHRINEANAKIRHSMIDGIGQKVASIDMEIYLQQMHLHGRDCWQQPDFLDKFLRDNPACRIRCELPSRVSMTGGVDGLSGRKEPTAAARKKGASCLHQTPARPRSSHALSKVQKHI